MEIKCRIQKCPLGKYEGCGLGLEIEQLVWKRKSPYLPHPEGQPGNFKSTYFLNALGGYVMMLPQSWATTYFIQARSASGQHETLTKKTAPESKGLEQPMQE